MIRSTVVPRSVITALALAMLAMGPCQAEEGNCEKWTARGLRVGMAYVDYIQKTGAGASSVERGRRESSFVRIQRSGEKSVVVSAAFLRSDNWPLVEVAIAASLTPGERDAMFAELVARWGTAASPRRLLTSPTERLAGAVTSGAGIVTPEALRGIVANLDAPDAFGTEWSSTQCDVRVSLVEYVDRRDRSYADPMPVIIILSKLDRSWHSEPREPDLALVRDLLRDPTTKDE